MAKKKIKAKPDPISIWLRDAANINYEFYEPNPANRKDCDARGDCVVRAMCKLTDIDWYTLYNEIIVIALKKCAMPESMICIYQLLSNHGLQPLPKYDGLVITFLMTHRTGKYFIIIIGHCFAYVDGTIYDSIDGKPLEESNIEWLLTTDIESIYELKDNEEN